jgi:uncharacterized protein DUF3237
MLPSQPRFEHVADLIARVEVPIEVSPTRRMIAISGGEVSGPRLDGTILPGGADVQVVRADSTVDLLARYVIQTSDGALIYVENAGLRHGPPEVMEKLRRGESVDQSLLYFRTTPRFETAAPQYQWLTKHIFVGIAARFPSHVEVKIFQLL